jgi:hypothetical protein
MRVQDESKEVQEEIEGLTEEQQDQLCVYYLLQEVDPIWGNEPCHTECERPFNRGLFKRDGEVTKKEKEKETGVIASMLERLLTAIKGGSDGEEDG